MSWIDQIGIAPNSIKALLGSRNEELANENARLRKLLSEVRIAANRVRIRTGIATIDAEQNAVRQGQLMAELHHRTKNTLAVVLAIASQSLRNAATLEEGRNALEERLLAMARAQDVLIAAHWAAIQMRVVLNTAIAPFDDHRSRFDLDIDNLEVFADSIVPLMLILNELCTNAIKYGALAVEGGRVAIKVHADRSGRRFRLTWTESGGPNVCKPAQSGFGSRSIKSLAKQLHGNDRLRYEAEGVIYELDAPFSLPSVN